MPFARRCFAPVDASSLALFRIAFGALMCAEIWAYHSRGWYRFGWIDPDFAFPYPGFEWVQAWSPEGMLVHGAILALAAACIAIGLFTRVAAAVFCAAWTWLFLIDQTLYVNHLYLICLLSGLLVFVPSERVWSLDAWRSPRGNEVPAWSLWLLRAQIGVVYLFAGVAKVDADWLRGEPVRSMFAPRTVGLPIDPEWVVWFVSYSGLILDLGVVPALLWRRTRAFAFASAVAFHLMNAHLFHIGVFPWLMIPATTLFLAPDWPRALLARLRGTTRASLAGDAPRLGAREWTVLALAGAYLAVQVAVPLRHFFYAGNASWTREGHAFSWRVMMLATRPVPRFVSLRVRDRATGETWTDDPRRYTSAETPGAMTDLRARVVEAYRERGQDVDVGREVSSVRYTARDLDSGRLLPIRIRDTLDARQERKLADDPRLIWAFGQHLIGELRRRGHERISLHVEAWASFPAREPQELVNADIDLARHEGKAPPANWVVPLAPRPD